MTKIKAGITYVEITSDTTWSERGAERSSKKFSKDFAILSNETANLSDRNYLLRVRVRRFLR